MSRFTKSEHKFPILSCYLNWTSLTVNLCRYFCPCCSILFQGSSRREFLLRTSKSYLVDFNTANKNAAFPSEIKIYGYGVES